MAQLEVWWLSGCVVAQLEVWWLSGGVVAQWRCGGSVGGVVAQLVSASVHWVTLSSPGFESRLEPATVGTLMIPLCTVRQKT